MVETPRSDNNVILTELVSAPTAAPTASANRVEDEIAANNFRRVLAEVQVKVASLPEPLRSEKGADVDQLVAMLTSNGGVVSAGLANALQELNSKVSEAVNASENTTDAVEDSVHSAINSYQLSAAGQAHVDAQMEALRSGNPDAIMRSFEDRPSPYGPQFDQFRREGKDQYERSAQGRMDLQALSRWATGTPEEQSRLKNVLHNRQARMEVLDHYPDAHLRNLLQNANVMSDPDSDALAAAMLSNAPAARIQELAYEVLDRRMGRLDEAFAPGSPYPQLQGRHEAILAALSPADRARAEASPDGMNAVMRDIYTTVNPDDAQRDYERSGHDFSRMEPRNRAFMLISSSLVTTSGQEDVQGTLRGCRGQDLVRLMELPREQVQGGRELRLYDALKTVTDANASLVDRARAVPGIIPRSASEVDHTVGMSALMLAFAAKHDPEAATNPETLLSYQQLMTDTTPAAVEFRRQFQAYVNQQIGTISNDVAGLGVDQAITSLGRQINNREIDLSQDANGNLSYYDYNTGTSRSTYVGAAGLSSIGSDYQGMLSNLFQQTRPGGARANDADFTAIVRSIDTYRLLSNPEYQDQYQQVVRDLYLNQSARPLSEIRTELNRITAGERQDYAEFSTDLLTTANGPQRQELERRGLVTNGQLDIDGFMRVVEENKVNFGNIYDNYLRRTTSSLRNSNTPLVDANGTTVPGLTENDLANARMMSEMVGQLRGLDSLEHLTDPEHANDIDSRIRALTAAGQPVPPALATQQRMMNALNGDPQSPEFAAAMREFMCSRDPYIAKKEQADVYFKNPDDRAQIVDRTVAIYRERYQAGLAPSTVPIAPPTPEPTATPPAAGQPTPAQPAPVAMPAGNENEGAGLLDRLSMNTFERQIFNAVKDLSAESRRALLGTSAVLNAENTGATGDQAFYSYNEIETALKRAGFSSVSQIADTKGDGFDVADIQAALNAAPPATPAVTVAGGQDQSTGRSS